MPDWRSDSKWAVDVLFWEKLTFGCKITSQEWVVSFSVVEESYSRFMLGARWHSENGVSSEHDYANTQMNAHNTSTAGAWSYSAQWDIEPSVGIKQTLQQTCFTRKRKLRSKFWWLTRFCNSHDVSHFAAFFIVVGAKTSVAESGLTLRSVRGCLAVSQTTEWVSGQLDVLSTHGFRMSEVKIKNGVFLWV